MKNKEDFYTDFIGTETLNDVDALAEIFRSISSTLTPKLKKRFCKDWNIPVKLYVEPYFSERLAVYNQYKFIAHKLGEFCELVTELGGEQNYFTYYNGVKDKAIAYLNENEALGFFRSKEDMSKYAVAGGFPTKDIYKQTFNGKSFISLDLVKGNFTALRHYNPEIVGCKETYEEFMALFTDSVYLQNSKYIRQVIFGNVTPKRQVAYEKYLMDKVLSALLSFIPKIAVVYFSTDEIVLDADEFTREQFNLIQETVNEFKLEGINVRLDYFSLHYIPEVGAYYKVFKDSLDYKRIELKNLESNYMAYVLRSFYKNSPSDNDAVFETEGRLARWLDVISIDSTGFPQVQKSWQK